MLVGTNTIFSYFYIYRTCITCKTTNRIIKPNEIRNQFDISSVAIPTISSGTTSTRSSGRTTRRVIDTRNIRFRCKSSAGLTSELNFISSYTAVPPRRPHTITLHRPPSDSTWSDLSKSEFTITLYIARLVRGRGMKATHTARWRCRRASASRGVAGARAANRYGRRVCVDLVPCIHALAL